MAFRAKTVNGSALEVKGPGQPRTFKVGSKTITITGMFDYFEGENKSFEIVDSEGKKSKATFGVPTEEMLKDPSLIIETISGRVWPGSFADASAPGAGHHQMFLEQTQGSWPDANEVTKQKNAHLRLKDPRRFKLAILEQHGITGRRAIRAIGPPQLSEDLTEIVEDYEEDGDEKDNEKD